MTASLIEINKSVLALFGIDPQDARMVQITLEPGKAPHIVVEKFLRRDGKHFVFDDGEIAMARQTFRVVPVEDES